MSQATYEDVNLLLKLYELRREDKMRQARDWFVANYKYKTLAEFTKACPPGSSMNAYARQVTTYWEMVASFIESGVLNRDLFYLNTRELLLCWIRVKPLIGELRETFHDPNYLYNLEKVGEAFAEWIKKTSGEDAFNGFKTRTGG